MRSEQTRRVLARWFQMSPQPSLRFRRVFMRSENWGLITRTEITLNKMLYLGNTYFPYGFNHQSGLRLIERVEVEPSLLH